MCYTLPKVWQERVPKYWDQFMPANYPKSSSEFSFKFDTEEETAAVKTFEDQLNTEESVVPGIIGEENFVSDYFGTFDVKGEAGELTLLSPEKIETDGEVVALHYVDGEWKKVEDAKVEGGYVWGTLDSFSPVAIIAFKRDIEEAKSYWTKAEANCIVANGNPIKVYTDEEKTVQVESLISGKKIALGSNSIIVGGTIDGTAVDSTKITVVGVENESLGIYTGSCCYIDPESEEEAPLITTNKSTNLTVIDSKIRAITGQGGRVRNELLNITVKNSSVKSHIACGETYNGKTNKDANSKDGLDLGFGSNGWCKKAVINLDNASTQLLFTGGNTGYTYTHETELTVKDSKIDYCIGGGSNGKTHSVKMDITKMESQIFQTNNRGFVDEVSAKITDSKIDNLFIFGDATDATVTGTTDSVAIDINSGTYNIKLGTQGGKVADDAEPVKFVKYSRSADVVIDADVAKLLGSKLISK
ncbi:MAG: hypothetical protein IKR19_08515 [Acholeplasmatales bacterium]|nr:hypothetical protein [Acholeplasmatales bacterium]